MLIEVKRDICKENFTLGKMYLDGEFYGYTLEDMVRKPGQKVPGKTAIPAGSYKVTITYSNHFKKLLPLINEVPGFEGVRIHGGNSAANTNGCLLVAKNRDSSRGIIWGSLSADLTTRVKAAVNNKQQVYITIIPEEEIHDGPESSY